MKYFLIATFAFLSHTCIGQQNQMYLKFTSSKITSPRAATISVNTKYVHSIHVVLPSDKYYAITCEVSRGVTIFPEVWPIPNKPNISFSVPGFYNCGDSVIINVDDNTATIINRKKL